MPPAFFNEIMELTYSEIKVGDRFRRDIGDLGPLKASIQKIGQLHPVIISEDHQLIAGYRRLQACKELGRLVEVKVVNIGDWLQAEHDENEERKNFTVSERVAILKAIEERVGDRQGQRTDQLPKHVTEVPVGEDTRVYAARKAGLGSFLTAQRAEAIVNNGAPELVEAVDKGEISIRPAYAISDLPKTEQAAVVKQGKKAVTKKANEIERTRERTKGKKKEETFAERRARMMKASAGPIIGVKKADVDPDFKGTDAEFIEKYGFVHVRTAAQIEIDRDQDAFSDWVGRIRKLRAPLGEYLKGDKFSPERFHAWMKKAPSKERRLTEINELVQLIVQTRETIDWLLPLLEAPQSNGDHP
jgi:ParB-like chromosome segregation protein Spo0J